MAQKDQGNVKSTLLFDPKKVLLIPWNIKLALVKNVVKAFNKDEHAFKYIKRIFPNLTGAKLKDGIFVETQIRKILKDEIFHQTLSNKADWKSFKATVFRKQKNKNLRKICKKITGAILQNRLSHVS